MDNSGMKLFYQFRILILILKKIREISIYACKGGIHPPGISKRFPHHTNIRKQKVRFPGQFPETHGRGGQSGCRLTHTY